MQNSSRTGVPRAGLNRNKPVTQFMPDTAILPGPEPAIAAKPGGWRAALSLGYVNTGGRTVLVHRRHNGPLVVQKPLYPEGEAVCHGIIVHPPGGIAGGDRLSLEVDAAAGSQVLLTTPGATKWYKANGHEASQTIRIAVADGGLVEWLPQENIVFDGAHMQLGMDIELAAEARYIGWEITVLGRRASGEQFAHGSVRQQTAIFRGGHEVYSEAARLEGGDALLASPVGLAGHHVFGTLIATGKACPKSLIAACREIVPDDGARHGMTQLPGALVARYLGSSPQAARGYFTALWQRLRPWLAGREACIPRIWQT